MLIVFKVSNFRSIRDMQTLSLVASKNKELMDSHTFDVQLAEQSSIKLLRSAAIYGPNAAGKTNLVRALKVMKTIVLTSALEKGREIRYRWFHSNYTPSPVRHPVRLK